MNIEGYITNLGKYNEGELIGKWITFPVDEDELSDILKEIGINDQYEEYFFTDWNCEVDLNLGEYVSISKVNEYAESLENWDDDLLLAACEVWGFMAVISEDPDDYILYSSISDEYDLGYYWINESGCYNVPDDIFGRYFDYEAFGRDLNIDLDGGFSDYGYIERMH